VSSLVDTWIVLETVRSGGERNHVLNIVKSRGMAHSNQTASTGSPTPGCTLLTRTLVPAAW